MNRLTNHHQGVYYCDLLKLSLVFNNFSLVFLQVLHTFACFASTIFTVVPCILILSCFFIYPIERTTRLKLALKFTYLHFGAFSQINKKMYNVINFIILHIVWNVPTTNKEIRKQHFGKVLGFAMRREICVLAEATFA